MCLSAFTHVHTHVCTHMCIICQEGKQGILVTTLLPETRAGGQEDEGLTSQSPPLTLFEFASHVHATSKPKQNETKTCFTRNIKAENSGLPGINCPEALQTLNLFLPGRGETCRRDALGSTDHWAGLSTALSPPQPANSCRGGAV